MKSTSFYISRFILFLIQSQVHLWLLILFPFVLVACNEIQPLPSKELIDELQLKRGEIISCGPPQIEFGSLNFEISGSRKNQQDFNVGVELLHSFEYDEAEKMFAKIIDESPRCAMAYWGIAMCSYHPLWEPPNETDLIKGSKAIGIADNLVAKSHRESDFIEALAQYYEEWEITDPRNRSIRFEKAMEELHDKYPGDTEAAIFYALALDAAADPTDKSFYNQKKAGTLLESLYKKQPNHPGIIHYIIHTYDYPALATLALPAARRYAQVAPSSAHALHMPSHIFTRLGMWEDCIQTNEKSVSSAKCYAEATGIKGHWDEELHGLDYLVYAYLQKGDNAAAQKQLEYIKGIQEVYPVNFKVAYTFSASPSRLVLENKDWQQAAVLQLKPNFPWQNFPWQEAIIHFARLLGAVHTSNLSIAQSELARLNVLYDTLQNQKDQYKSKQVAIQITTGRAWIALMNERIPEALELMGIAVAMEDSTSKHPVTPGEVLPARELYADMLLQLKQNENALAAYEKVLERSPNRFNSLYGAGLAAERSGLIGKAKIYYDRLCSIAAPNSNRSEIALAKLFLRKHSGLVGVK